MLLMPLLNDYYILVELSVKYLFDSLDEHLRHKKCKFITHDFPSECKKRTTHDVLELFEEIRQFISDKKSPHYFHEFYFLEEIINEFHENGINAFSPRYFVKKDMQEIEQLHKKQVNINIVKLHEDIKKAVDLIIYYAKDYSFEYCSRGFYSKHEVNKLKDICKVCRKFKPLIDGIFEKNDNDNKEPSIIQISDTTIEDFLRYKQEVKKFIENMDKLAIFNIAAILKCSLHGSRLFFEVDDIDYFIRSIERDRNFIGEHKDNVKLFFNTGLTRLEKIIKKLEKYCLN